MTLNSARIIPIALMVALLTACGGGSGGSTPDTNNHGGNSSGGGDKGNGGGGNNGGGDGGGGNTPNEPASLTFANTDLAYLSFLDGERKDDSQFTQMSISGTHTTIDLTDEDGLISLLVACSSNRLKHNAFKMFDLKVTGAREFDLNCKEDQTSDRNLVIQATKPMNDTSDPRLFGVTLGGNDVFQHPTWVFNQFLITFSKPYSVMAVAKSAHSNDLKLYSNTNQTFNQASTSLGIIVNSNPTLDTVTPPTGGIYYQLEYHSPSRFAFPLRTGRSDWFSAGAGLIPESLQVSGDYYVESWYVSNGFYTHQTSEPQANGLFGADKTYEGKGTKGNYTFVDTTFTLSQEPIVDSSVSQRALSQSVSYGGRFTSDADKYETFSLVLYSEDVSALVFPANPSRFLIGHTLPSNMELTVPFDSTSITSYVASVNVLYDNGVTGDGRVTYTAYSERRY